ncbi:MAG: LytR C-terminal domain-containing protein [Corynebacteriales bacterium]|nr:LytR C-terminal domain-containing protein [Mycobacteriales bacterium]
MSLARMRSLIVLGVLGALAAATVVWAITHDSQETPADKICKGAIKPVLTLPDPSQVKLRILNATDTKGLASKVQISFEKRGYTQIEIGNADDVVEGSAQVRYGPRAAGSAQLVRGNIVGATVRPDNRRDDVVELLIGPEFADKVLAADEDADSAMLATDKVEAATRKLGKPALATPKCEEDEDMDRA